MMQDTDGVIHEYLCKVLVVGAVSAGKTSLLQRYVRGKFAGFHSTVSCNDGGCVYCYGVEFLLKCVQTDPTTRVRMQLWDISGHERWGNMTRAFYKDGAAAIVVFDVMDSQSFAMVEAWKNDLDQKARLQNDEPLPVILLANKIDRYMTLKNATPWDPSMMDDYCKQHGFVAWFKTSALDSTGIDDAFGSLVQRLLENANTIALQQTQGKPETIALTVEPRKEKSLCSSC